MKNFCNTGTKIFSSLPQTFHRILWLSHHFRVTCYLTYFLKLLKVHFLILDLHMFVTVLQGQVENLETSEISELSEIWAFFSEIFKSEFSILAVGQNRKLGNKKTRNNFSEISEVYKFSICHFFIFFLIFFPFFCKHFFKFFNLHL